MTPAYEQFLIDTVLPQLERGRVGWDLPHTQHVVRYCKQILRAHPELGLTREVLVTVAYVHDYGYIYFADQLQKGPTQGVAKQMHARKSATYWERIQDEPVFGCFSREQKKRIQHLICVHDDIENLTDTDELAFMEADTLGALVMGNKDKIGEDRYNTYIDFTNKRRVSRFITQYSRDEVVRILSHTERPK